MAGIRIGGAFIGKRPLFIYSYIRPLFVEDYLRPISLFMTASLLFTLTSCGSQDSGEGVGGVTASEARALNDAAEMLDSRSSPSPENRTD